MIKLNSFIIQYVLVMCFLLIICQIFTFLSKLLIATGTMLSFGWLAWQVTVFIRRSIDKPMIHVSDKAVLITGCDSGFGRLLAKKLNDIGFFVFAGCLNPLSVPSNELKTEVKYPDKISIIKLDITKEEDIAAVKHEVSSVLMTHNCSLWALINSATVFTCGNIEWGQLSCFRHLFEVNVLGHLNVTRTFLPLIRASKGRVVNLTSTAARFAEAGLSGFSMSKSAFLAFTDSLRREMQQWSVNVINIETDIYKQLQSEFKVYARLDEIWNETESDVRRDYGANYYYALKDRVRFMLQSSQQNNPEEVVQLITDAILHVDPEFRYRLAANNYATVFWWLIEILPIRLIDSISNLMATVSVKPKALENE